MTKRKDPETPLRKGGRPPSWTDPDAMQIAVDAYFTECDNRIIKKQHVTGKGIIVVKTPEPYTMAGLAHALGIARETLNQYKAENHPCHKDEPKKAEMFSDIIMHAREKIHRSNVTLALVGCHDSRIAALNLASNYGYGDRQQVEQTGEMTLKVIYGEEGNSNPPPEAPPETD